MSEALRLRFSQEVQALEQPLARLRRDDLSLGERLDLVAKYEELTSLLYRVRGAFGARDPFRVRAEDFLSSLSQELLTQQKERPRPEDSFLHKYRLYRATWQRNFSLFTFCLVLFVAAIAIGWIMVETKPASATLFMSQDLIERIIDNRAWFNDVGNPVFAGVMIALNNMRVGLMSYIFSGIFGVGGLWFLAYNGMYFGAIFAFCRQNRFDDQLGSFVIAHGVLELTLIVCATFAGLLLGRVFFMRPLKFFQKRIQLGGRESLTVAGGVIPWFIVCAFVESFLSPLPDVDPGFRWLVGLTIAVGFWLWTLWPVDPAHTPA